MGQVDYLERSLWWYKILPKARSLLVCKAIVVYVGRKWWGLKDWTVRLVLAPYLLATTHPIWYAELCYRARPTVQTLKTYSDIVFETAEFMASFAVWDAEKDRYVLGPPVIPAQENHKPEETINPAFELEYWHFGLN